MDKHRLVQQYVERQKAFLPTYTTERPWNERHGIPPKPIQGCDFGFDTPVLLPRVLLNQPERTQKAGPSKSREAGLAHSSLDPPPASADGRETSRKDKARPKRKEGSSSNDTESERAARLADRRERKRKKRAIVNPPQKHTAPTTTAPQKGKTNSQKAKKPAALALLYGFSATNVTKDRLTLRPTLGVFSKGRASAKKQVAAAKRASSRKEVFSECAFLNRLSEQAADHSKVDDDSDDSSVSSISNEPMPRVAHLTSRTRKNRDNTETTGSKPRPQAPTRTTAESEIWDIELQSKLPSTAGDVSSEYEENNSAPVVLDLRGAEWTVAEEHEERGNETWSQRMSDTHSPGLHRAQLGIPNMYDEVGQGEAAGAPSIHPSHSASQVGGRRVGDREPPQVGQMTSKYFLDAVELVADDGVNSLIGVAQPMLGFEMGYYDVEPLVFPSDDIDEQGGVDDDGGCAEDDVIYETSFIDPSVSVSVSDEMEPGGLLSGLAQAEMDVAGQLRNHWRPQRLS